VVNSREIADEIRRLEGVPEARIRLIHNGIDLSRFDRARREPLPAPFPAGEGPAVGMIANLVPVKGHADLLEAFARVRRERSDARLVLVGDGPLRAALEARAGGEDLAGAVHFAGRHPAPPWIDRFDVAVQSSVSEGMSNVLLEYMAAGRPMAVTAVGATPEALEDGVHGRLVPPRDPAALAAAILDLLRDPERAARLGTAARARVEERFTAARMVRRMEDLYDAMVGSLRIG
jgi:glycosyltransferase involved in cell wall biosynthesis